MPPFAPRSPRAKVARASWCSSARRSTKRGGNSRFTAGAMRVAYNGVDDLARLMPDLTEEDKANTDFGAYPSDQFYDDLCRVTQYRTDPQLAETLVGRSFETMLWMREQGHPLRADLWTAGIQGRWQVQILGRPDGRGVGRRSGPDRCALRRRRTRRHRGVVREPRGRTDSRRRRRPWRSRAQDTDEPSASRP